MSVHKNSQNTWLPNSNLPQSSFEGFHSQTQNSTILKSGSSDRFVFDSSSVRYFHYKESSSGLRTCCPCNLSQFWQHISDLISAKDLTELTQSYLVCCQLREALSFQQHEVFSRNPENQGST
eukprot:Blabericola_migrator_1__873@NODE_1213_length_5100_cov_46_971985_g823_i0_p5_GENE_NODE_1213_length_5100_cov_46_971985_g823_i0NODE_1213_length_5100_cov_46_971985_g823_i0_p5_ORF_typecomplete_len122_score12_95_NODE_1213_length_5100_cov_46_971985_g823_i011261491